MHIATGTKKDIAHLQPPEAFEVEQAVLGSILKDVEAVNAVLEVLTISSYFYDPRHQKIFTSMLALYERSEPCDITTVAEELSRTNDLDQVGGRVYLVELAESVASTANVGSYAKIVLDKAVLRGLIQTSNEIVKSCYSAEKPVEELLDLAERNIFRISESRLRSGFIPMKELVQSTFNQIEDMHSQGGAFSGLKTGFDKIDIMTNGLHKSELIIIAGRPSMGKTSLAMNIAEYISTNDANPRGVGVFSIEMSREALALRMLCSRSRLSQHHLRSGKLTEQDFNKLTFAGGTLGKAPLFIDDSPTLSALELRAKARRLKSKHDIGLIIVDYIQLMHGHGNAENRNQEISMISRALKATAKELDIPVIAISQLSRAVEQRSGEKRPQLSDLRESGAIEQDADLVMFVYRPEFYLSHLDRDDIKFKEVEGLAEIIIAKQRNGPTGSAKLIFLKEYTRFENLAQAHREIPPGVEPVSSDSPF